MVKNVKAWPLKKLRNHIGHNLNMSQIWLCGFELATNHHCNHSSYYLIDKFQNKFEKGVLQNW